MKSVLWLEQFAENCHRESTGDLSVWSGCGGVSSVKEGRRVAGLRLLEPERVMWGVVPGGFHRRWGDCLENVECEESSEGLLLHGVQGWLKGMVWWILQWPYPRGQWQEWLWGRWVSPSHSIYLLTLIPCGMMVVLVFWGEHCKDIPFRIREMKKGSWSLGVPRAGANGRLLFKVSKRCHPPLSE